MSGEYAYNSASGREPGLLRALAQGGGVRPTARKLGLRPQSVADWTKVPRARLFEVARAVGLEPEEIRPDLADWIIAERERGWMERARARFAIGSERAGQVTAKSPRDHDRPDSQTMDLLDLGLIVAAVRFAARERGLSVAAIMGAPRGGAGGAPTPAQSARSYAMSLAVVVGRVNAETVAGLMGLTRQAVDNAAERYLRAREGDGEFAEPGPNGVAQVLERGRMRVAKAADDSLWSAERRFVAQLTGEA